MIISPKNCILTAHWSNHADICQVAVTSSGTILMEQFKKSTLHSCSISTKPPCTTDALTHGNPIRHAQFFIRLGTISIARLQNSTFLRNPNTQQNLHVQMDARAHGDPIWHAEICHKLEDNFKSMIAKFFFDGEPQWNVTLVHIHLLGSPSLINASALKNEPPQRILAPTHLYISFRNLNACSLPPVNMVTFFKMHKLVVVTSLGMILMAQMYPQTHSFGDIFLGVLMIG